MDDYIKRSDAIDALISVTGIKGTEYNELKKKLEAIPGVWNDAKETFPDDDRMVVCRGDRGGYYIAKYIKYYWYRIASSAADCNPIVWMDIPEERAK